MCVSPKFHGREGVYSCSVYTSVYTSEVMCVLYVRGRETSSLTLSFSWLMSPFRECNTRPLLIGSK